MAQSSRQQEFGDAFLWALAGVAGCALSERRPDDDSIDWTLSCKLPTRPKLDLQMKTWVGDDGKGPDLRYPLSIKNYSDLILTNILVPRILVVVSVPHQLVDWTDCTSEQLILRTAAYWAKIEGESKSDQDTVTVYLPRGNLLTADVLQDIMRRIDEGQPV